MTVDLSYTGERLVPDQFAHTARIVTEHLERYRYAARTISEHSRAQNLKIMDIPCGAGYGSALIAAQMDCHVFGYDIDVPTVHYARDRYGQHMEEELTFAYADMTQPIMSMAFDAIVCFEGIEHVTGQAVVATNLCRALKPGGLIFVSTPRRGGPGGGSEFHTEELTRDELEALFRPHLTDIKVLGQDLRVGDSKPDEHARFYVLVGRR